MADFGWSYPAGCSGPPDDDDDDALPVPTEEAKLAAEVTATTEAASRAFGPEAVARALVAREGGDVTSAWDQAHYYLQRAQGAADRTHWAAVMDVVIRPTEAQKHGGRS
jgi:hypothetical protein